MTRHVRFVLVLLIALLLVPFAPASGAPVLFDPDADVDYQLSGGYDVSAGIVVRDRTDEPAPGAYNLCYVNAFQTQPDEVLLDRWVAGCARNGYDALEPDNLDSLTRSDGLLRRRHNLALAALRGSVWPIVLRDRDLRLPDQKGYRRDAC